MAVVAEFGIAKDEALFLIQASTFFFRDVLQKEETWEAYVEIAFVAFEPLVMTLLGYSVDLALALQAGNVINLAVAEDPILHAFAVDMASPLAAMVDRVPVEDVLVEI